MSYIDKKYLTFKFKVGTNKRNYSVGYGSDRHPEKDRRKSSHKKYFLEGGLEKRSWKEGRKYWYMTM